MRNRVESVLLSGVVTGVLVTLLELVPIWANCLVCTAYIGSGVVAVWHFTNTYSVATNAGHGAIMGALAAPVGAVVSKLVDHALALLGARQSLVDQIQEGMETLESSGMREQQIEQLRELMASPLFLMAAVFVALVVVALLGAAGGAAGATMFKVRRKDEG